LDFHFNSPRINFYLFFVLGIFKNLSPSHSLGKKALDKIQGKQYENSPAISVF